MRRVSRVCVHETPLQKALIHIASIWLFGWFILSGYTSKNVWNRHNWKRNAPSNSSYRGFGSVFMNCADVIIDPSLVNGKRRKSSANQIGEICFSYSTVKLSIKPHDNYDENDSDLKSLDILNIESDRSLLLYYTLGTMYQLWERYMCMCEIDTNPPEITYYLGGKYLSAFITYIEAKTTKKKTNKMFAFSFNVSMRYWDIENGKKNMLRRLRIPNWFVSI